MKTKIFQNEFRFAVNKSEHNIKAEHEYYTIPNLNEIKVLCKA